MTKKIDLGKTQPTQPSINKNNTQNKPTNGVKPGLPKFGSDSNLFSPKPKVPSFKVAKAKKKKFEDLIKFHWNRKRIMAFRKKQMTKKLQKWYKRIYAEDREKERMYSYLLME